jgi:hypothetical protein
MITPRSGLKAPNNTPANQTLANEMITPRSGLKAPNNTPASIASDISTLTDTASYQSITPRPTKTKSLTKTKTLTKTRTPTLSLSIVPKPTVPTHKMSHERLQEFIKEHFSPFKWDKVKIENACGTDMIPEDSMSPQSGGSGQVIEYTPTQSFISNYFTPDNFAKGMLLWHSVGTGKTCSAIAAATKNFEPAGYTILWVTRSTLKNDIWKNMFDQICNEDIRQRVLSGDRIPEDHLKRMHMLSKSWAIRPLSYKQFTNLVSQNNQYYDELVKINGKEDVLRKTLLIIDEAHKLYGGGDLSGVERPDMKALKQFIMNSYIKSGKDSVRLLLMTATPITENPMELVKLINLCKLPEEQMPESFQEFAHDYLNEDGTFTRSGENKYVQNITGLVSYLNREFDVRQFAQPTITYLTDKPMSSLKEIAQTEDDLFFQKNEKSRTQKLKELNDMPVFKNANAKSFAYLSKECDRFKTKKTKTNGYEACKKIVKNTIHDLLDRIKAYKEFIIEEYNLKKGKKGQSKGQVMDERYKLSIYYNLLTKCQKALKPNAEEKGKGKKAVTANATRKVTANAMMSKEKSPIKGTSGKEAEDNYEINLRTEEIGNVRKEIELIQEEIREIKKIKSPTKEITEMLHMLEKNLENKEKYLVFVREEIEHIKKSLAELQLMENKEQKKQKTDSHFTDDEISKIYTNVERLVNESIREIDKQILGLD